MATKEEASKAWASFRGGVQMKTPVRFALTGDGRGNATSNLVVDAKNDYIYVREYSDLTRYFPVLNRGKVGPFINMPVIIGYDQTEIGREQVLGVNYDALPAGQSLSMIYAIGRHHWQHEFGGGDEVWVDSRQFMPGLVVPTTPPSMNVEVRPLLYYYGQWQRFAGSTTDTMSQYKPEGAFSRYVLISLDQDTGSLLYKPGLAFTVQQTFDALLSSGSETDATDYLPKPNPHEMPLGAVYLTSATSVVNWVGAASNLIDARLHNMFSIDDLIDRVNVLERSLGISDTLPTLGAAQYEMPSYNPYLSKWQLQEGTTNIYRIDSQVGINVSEPNVSLQVGGDVRVGEINDLNSGTFPAYGRKLYFSGGPAGATYNSENSDTLWLARMNEASDKTQLRVSIGDNHAATNDAFAIGVENSGNWHQRFAVYGDGKAIFASPSATSANDLAASQLTFHVDEAANQIIFFCKYANGTTVKAGSINLV